MTNREYKWWRGFIRVLCYLFDIQVGAFAGRLIIDLWNAHRPFLWFDWWGVVCICAVFGALAILPHFLVRALLDDK